MDKLRVWCNGGTGRLITVGRLQDHNASPSSLGGDTSRRCNDACNPKGDLADNEACRWLRASQQLVSSAKLAAY